MTLTSYHDLIVWQRAIDFVVDCYELSGKFPRTELYGLMCQLQRAAVSVPSTLRRERDGGSRGSSSGTRESRAVRCSRRKRRSSFPNGWAS